MLHYKTVIGICQFNYCKKLEKQMNFNVIFLIKINYYAFFALKKEETVNEFFNSFFIQMKGKMDVIITFLITRNFYHQLLC